MSRTRIIAVDDDRRILRILKRACESMGYETHPVVDPELFESAFHAFKPSLVFLDLGMDNIDGIELLRFIARQRADTAVVVTSGVDERLLGAAHTLGVSLGVRMLKPIRKPLVVADVRMRLKMFRNQPPVAARPSLDASNLQQALSDGLLEVCYQPMLKLSTSEVVSIEALARIRDPGVGLLMPEHFIPVAEQSGLIDMLTFSVLERALTDLKAVSALLPRLQMAVNLSPLLMCDETLPDRIATQLRRHRIRAERLIVEVTETHAPDDRQRMAEILSRLRLKGIHLALDDFGTGFCSLGQLYEFPYEMLKLDKTFAIHADCDATAAAMIRSSLDLARCVGLEVVAEGIQSEATMRWLDRLGCQYGQGFYISPPLSFNELTDWLVQRTSTQTRAGSTSVAAA